MASSQVEIASSAPFGCVLRDHNHKHNHSHSNHNRLDGCKTAQDAFRRNLKDLVRGHIHKCISVSSDSGSHEEPSSLDQNPWLADHKRINTHGSLRFKRADTGSPSTSNTSNKEEWLSDLSPRKSRILERWAAQQARDMVSTIEKQSQEDELVASSSSSDDASTNTDISNLGASSLVQVWEARLNHSSSNSSSSKVNSVPPASPTSRNNLPLASSTTMEESSMVSDAVEPGYEDRLISPEGSLGRSESDRTATDEQSSSQDRDSETGNQSQWVRVADIIKRLTSSRREQSIANLSSSRERERTPVPDHSLHPVTPRLRGRMAFNDLLMQLERDRHRELESLEEIHAVSKFQQRGRIQSLLKIKILQHRNGVQPQWRPNQPNNVPQSSGIMHLRERFDTPTDNASAPALTPRNSHAPQADHASCSENSVTTNTPEEKNHSSQVRNSMQQPKESSSPIDVPTNNSHRDGDHRNHTEQCTLPLQLSRINTNGDINVNFTPRSDAMSQHTSFEDSTDEFQPLDTFSSLTDWFEDAMMEEGEKEVEDEDEEQENIAESSYDWISSISRPRSYWENLRQEWYREMLEATSVKEDIRQLLQRRTVSTFLSSDFRDRMNHLMMSHIERQSHLEALEEEDLMETGIEERMEQLMSSFLHQQSNSVSDSEETDEGGVEDDEEEEGEGEGEEGNEREEIMEEDNDDGQEDEEGNPLGEIINDYDEGEEDGEGIHREEMMEDYDEEEEDEEGSLRDEITEDDDEEEEEISTRHQSDELQTYYYQATPTLQMSPSPPSRLGRYRDHENNSDREQVASTSSQDLPPYHPYYQDTRRHSSPIERLSVEMELINDLRAQMKQLYQEMSELRRSINCCMDMQVKLQGSFMQHSNSAQAKGKRSVDAAPRKGICCICYETQVDSLLYRCGHMCTCLRCAHELQWSSGKCPICRAPIVDVVRAFTDT